MNEAKGGVISDYFGAAFWQIGNALKRRAAAALRPQNITYVQFMVLRAVDELRQKQSYVSQTDIAGALQANPMVISGVVRSLKKQKLLSVRIHPRDSRAKHISITEQGGATLAQSHQLMMAMESRFFESVQIAPADFNQQLWKLGRSHPFTLDAL
jgi:DNA-binding MarR family transcriptional regulator